MNTELQLIALLVFMLLGALVAVETRDLLSSVISVGMVGFGVSVGFLILGAPDLAITQVVVEIICLVILIRATVVRDDTVVQRHQDTFAMAAGMVALTAVLVACAAVYVQKGRGRGLPPVGDPVALRPYSLPGEEAGPRGVSRRYLDERADLYARGRGRDAVHTANRVCAIVLDYRGYDTLGEATVILTGILGALVILREKGKSDGRDERDS